MKKTEVKDIQTWVKKRIKDQRRQLCIENALLRMRCYAQAKEAMAYGTYYLQNGEDRGTTTLVDLYRYLSRLGWAQPSKAFTDMGPPDVLKTLNQQGWPCPMPFHNEPWPNASALPEVASTVGYRRKAIGFLRRFYEYSFQVKGSSPDDAAQKARRYTDHGSALKPVAAVKHQTRVDASEEDWQAFISHIKNRSYEYEPAMYMWWMVAEIFQDEPNRSPGLVKANIADVLPDGDARNPTPRIMNVGGPAKKSNLTIFLTRESARQAAREWLARHPGKGDPKKSPLLIQQRAALRGKCIRLTREHLCGTLARFGPEAGLKIKTGPRAHRQFAHDEMWERGVSTQEMQDRFDRPPGSSEEDKYWRPFVKRAIRLMRRQRGMDDDPERACPKCGYDYPAGLPPCVHPSCPTRGAAGARSTADELALLGQALQRRGVEIEAID